MKRKDISNWLNYAFSQYPYPEFFRQLENQLPILFEELVGHMIDWDRCNLFIEPIDDRYIFHYEIANAPLIGYKTRDLVVMKCSLNHVKGNIAWYNNSGLETIHISDDVNGRELKFQIQDFHLRTDISTWLPKLNSAKKEIRILFSMHDTNIYYSNIPHEGYISILFNELPLPGMQLHIEKTFLDARDLWNSKKDNGTFHDISFHSMKSEKTALFYFDFGSSPEGALKYLISALEKYLSSISRIEIIGV